MIIKCLRCKKVIAQQKPFSDLSEVKAKCVSCLDKEKEEARKAKPIPELGKEREVIFENGWKGRLSIAGKETDELSFWDLIVAGKKFSCSEEEQDKVKKYLNKLTENDVDLTFFHSMSVKLDKSLDGRKKKQTPPAKEKKPEESIHYNCTVRVPKHYVLSMLKDKASRMQQFTDILADATLRMYKEECQKAAENGDKPMMSSSKQDTASLWGGDMKKVLSILIALTFLLQGCATYRAARLPSSDVMSFSNFQNQEELKG